MDLKTIKEKLILYKNLMLGASQKIETQKMMLKERDEKIAILEKITRGLLKKIYGVNDLNDVGFERLIHDLDEITTEAIDGKKKPVRFEDFGIINPFKEEE